VTRRRWLDLLLVMCGMVNMQLCLRLLPCFCRRLGAFAIHICMVPLLLLVFLSLPGKGPGADGIDARA
jgi:predicted membrane chloride channel (bestrophin family)